MLICNGTKAALTHFRVQHDFRRPVPSRGDVLREETGMVVLRIRHPGEAKVADFKVTRGVQKQITGLQISMQNVRRVDVLQAPKNLVQEVTYVIVTDGLRKHKSS